MHVDSVCLINEVPCGTQLRSLLVHQNARLFYAKMENSRTDFFHTPGMHYHLGSTLRYSKIKTYVYFNRTARQHV